MASKNKSESSEIKPRCGGRPCPDCGQCNDWYYTGRDWNHIRNWKNWSSDDWTRYGTHVVRVVKGDPTWSRCPGNCRVAGYYQWQYHSGPDWCCHNGNCNYWRLRDGATCTCSIDLPGYGYSDGGVYHGCLHHHNRDYGPWCMCRNNLPDGYVNE